MKRLIVIFLILLSFVAHAQIGGRMKEHKNQKRFMRHIARSGWHYNPTRPGKMQTHRREGRKLFTRNITNGKLLKYKIQGRINRDRARRRVRGNVVFSRRKYHRV